MDQNNPDINFVHSPLERRFFGGEGKVAAGEQLLLLWIGALLCFSAGALAAPETSDRSEAMSNQRVVFATYAGEPTQISNAMILAKSIHRFGGAYAQVPLWIVAPDDFAIAEEQTASFRTLGISLYRAGAPESIRWLFYADKPYAAAAAESLAEGKVDILLWLDDDAVVLDEPSEIAMPDSACLLYRPVMHNRSGSLYDSPPDPFWSRIYDLLKLDDNLLFPMISPADQQKIRAYFHCGFLAVRPERGILRRWAEDFATLAADSGLAAWCREDSEKRVFLHQTALTGSILHLAGRNEMVAFSDRYNYPIFFKQAYGGVIDYTDLSSAAVIRVHFNPARISPDWPQLLKGPADRIKWLQEHF